MKPTSHFWDFMAFNELSIALDQFEWHYKQLTRDNPRLSPLLIHVIIQDSVISHVIRIKYTGQYKNEISEIFISFLNIMNNHDLHIQNSALQFFL